MKWSKKIIFACMVLGTTISLTACGKTREDASGKVEIEFFNQKKEMTQTIQEIAKDFEAKNPDVHVKVVDVPNAGEVIKTRILAGDVPDVINLYPQSIELKEWAKAGYLEDLT
nr:extracellular solute-binding protein [Enterococcus sp.]